MPRTPITITDSSRAGVNQPAQQNSDNANNHSLWNDGKVILELSAVTATTTFTLHPGKAVDGQAVADRVYPVAITQPVYAGPFPPEIYNDPATGLINIDVSSANGRIRAIHVPG